MWLCASEIASCCVFGAKTLAKLVTLLLSVTTSPFLKLSNYLREKVFINCFNLGKSWLHSLFPRSMIMLVLEFPLKFFLIGAYSTMMWGTYSDSILYFRSLCTVMFNTSKTPASM